MTEKRSNPRSAQNRNTHSRSGQNRKRSAESPAQKRRKRETDAPASDKDPLGKLIKHYEATMARLVGEAIMIALFGIGVLAFTIAMGALHKGLLLAGVAILIAAVLRLFVGRSNVGRRLELRKRGLRFIELGVPLEVRWDEIVDVDVARTDSTDYGLVGVHKTSADGITPSGPLTSTEFGLTIRTHDDRRIHLPPEFMKVVDKPTELISNLRLRAGMP